MKWSTTKLFLSAGKLMSSSSNKLLMAVGTALSPDSARRTLEPALTNSTRRFGVRAGPRPLALVGRRRRWE